MKLAELSAPRQFRLVQGPDLEPGPGEVRARVTHVGVCGSDLHYYAEGSIGDIPCVYPMVLGHEPSGIIDRIGPGVTGWSVGDRVFLEPALFCYHCEFCRTGRHNLCTHLRFMSMPQEPGFFREQVLLPAHNVLALPSGLGGAEATLIEPLAIIVHSLQLIRPAIGETFAVWGAGAIGLLTVALLRLNGAGRIWCIEPAAARREMALRVGADAAIDPRQADPVKELLADTGGRGVDAAVDCVTAPGTINQCIRAAAPGGRVVVTGIPAEVQVPLDFHIMRRKELTFMPVRRSCHENERALALLQAHPKLFGPLITHTEPLDEIGAAFHLAENYDQSPGRVVVQVS